MTRVQYLDNLRNNLLRIMEEKDWTLIELSICTGISIRRLSDIVSGKAKDIRLSSLTGMSERLEIPLATLIGADMELEIGRYKRVVTSVFNELKPYVAGKAGK